MPGPGAALTLLLEEKNPAADDALGLALTCAGPEATRAIAETLLARNQPAGLFYLVEQYHRLDSAARQRVLDDGERVFRVLREAFNARLERTRLNVLEVIRHARLYRAAYLLEAGLHDRQPRVRESAAEALAALAETLCTAAPVRAGAAFAAADPAGRDQQRLVMGDLESHREDRRQLASALGMGVVNFGLHLQPRIIEAAMWLIDDVGTRFWSAASGASSRALRAAITILEESASPRLVPFAMEALARAEFRPHVLRLLAVRRDPEFLAEWLRQAWRLAEPRLARTLAAVKELACLEERGAALLTLPADAERHVSRWIRLTGLPAETRVLALKELYRRGGTPLRRTAVWELAQCGDPRGLSLLRAIASEPEAECSMIARLELARRCPDQYPPSELLPGSQPGVARPVRTPRPAMTLERYWGEFDELSPEQRVRLGTLLFNRFPRARALLHRHLSNADAQYRVRALKIITALGLSVGFADQIYPLNYDPHPDVRSAAVAALAQVPGGTSRRIVQQALIDPDNRVQANAVEAAAEGRHVQPEALLPKLASTDNRVRANAVRVLLQLGAREAAETLLRMLQDPDRRQRVSALWLIDKMGLFSLAGRVIDMAGTDQDPDVRARALEIRERLMRERPQETPA